VNPFDPLTTGALLILAAGAQGAAPPKVTDGCQIPRPAAISVVPKSAELVIDSAQSLAAIQTQKIDTINPYGYDVSAHTNGYMSGTLGMQSAVYLDYSIDSKTGGLCIWYDKVAVTIDLEPKIVIASEVAKDRCMSRAVLEHEKKHVTADRKIANKFAKSIGKIIYDGLEQRGFLVGPIPQASAQDTADRMKETVGQLIALQAKKMDIERAEAQQAIDSLEEYQRVKAQCPNFKAPTPR
jgi:hypothetical protein